MAQQYIYLYYFLFLLVLFFFFTTMKIYLFTPVFTIDNVESFNSRIPY